MRNTQLMHASLASHVTRYTLAAGSVGAQVCRCSIAQVTEQAAMIAYNNDFKLMMILTVCVIPFVFLLRDVQRQKSVAVVLE